MTPRHCEGLNARQEPCGAVPLKPGTALDGVTVTGRWCRQHDQDLPDSARIGGTQPGAGRPPLPKPSDVARRVIEDNVCVVLAPHFRALGYDIAAGADGIELSESAGGGAKLHGVSKDGEVRVSSHDDLGAQIAASEKLQDRIYGRPKQSQEISGPFGASFGIGVCSIEPDPDRSAAIARILRDAGATPEGS